MQGPRRGPEGVECCEARVGGRVSRCIEKVRLPAGLRSTTVGAWFCQSMEKASLCRQKIGFRKHIGVLDASLSYIGVLEASLSHFGVLEGSLSYIGVLEASLRYTGVLEAQFIYIGGLASCCDRSQS